MQTLDNMFSKGVIDDAVSYLENIPDRYVKDKRRLIESIKAHRDTQKEKGDEKDALH